MLIDISQEKVGKSFVIGGLYEIKFKILVCLIGMFIWNISVINWNFGMIDWNGYWNFSVIKQNIILVSCNMV